MFKDTPKGLLEAVLAVHKESREKFVQEQKKRLAKTELGKMPKSADGRADPAAHSGARTMATEMHGNQHKLDVAKPKGKLTAADFEELRRRRKNDEGKGKRLFGIGRNDDIQPRGGAGFKAGRAYGGANQKDQEFAHVSEAKQLKPGEAAPGIKGIWPGSEPKTRISSEKQIEPGLKSIMVKGRGYDKPTNARLAPGTIPGSISVKTTSTAAGHSPIDARLVAAQASSRQPGSMQASDAEDWKKRMGTYPRVVRGKSGKAAITDTSLDYKEELEFHQNKYGGIDVHKKSPNGPYLVGGISREKDGLYHGSISDGSMSPIHRFKHGNIDALKTQMTKHERNSRLKSALGLNNSYTYEEKDTPGNGYTHQCALHVKSEQYGEGRTLTSQHAEPDAQGHIAWYDVMFAEGIVRMNAEDLEILVSESHGNHKKMKK